MTLKTVKKLEFQLLSLKKLNRKFQKMVQKLDILSKEKEELENSNKSLETDRKKIAEKWQQ